jgi:hypothetical protein
MKKAARSAGGQFQDACADFSYRTRELPEGLASYPRYIPGADRSVSEITALLYRCSRDGWGRRSCLEIAHFSDRNGDGMTALYWLRQARRYR